MRLPDLAAVEDEGQLMISGVAAAVQQRRKGERGVLGVTMQE